MKTSPTQLSLRELRSLGYDAQVVERWNSFAGVRQDLFGWIDIVAVKGFGFPILGVQTTTRKNLTARLRKARGNAKLAQWVRSGGQLVVHGWEKVMGRWHCETRLVEVSDLVEGEGHAQEA